ncbi:MAG: molybdenum cofactor guanylyltransferase MobA, partial [Alphaproteobacteria bacterium]
MNSLAGEAVVGVLLAGGQSRRMGGGDKCLLELGGRPLLAHAIERLRPQVTALVLNANGDPRRFSAFGLPVTADPVEGFAGPLAGVLAGIDWAQVHAPESRWIVTAASDTPFFPA